MFRCAIKKIEIISEDMETPFRIIQVGVVSSRIKEKTQGAKTELGGEIEEAILHKNLLE